MGWIDVRTQQELDAALERGGGAHCVGPGEFVVWGSATVHASDSATVRAYGSATVRAWGSATVHAWGSATVHASGSATVRAWGSATVHAYGSATVHAYDSTTVHASDSATVHASDSATVRASKFVAVTKIGLRTKVVGGVQIQIPEITTADEWCDFYGVPIDAETGLVTLFKVVDETYHSGRGFDYTPGTTPVAPDWDGGVRECGGGLHFCPTPMHADRYAAIGWWPHRLRYIACPVRVSEIVVHNPADYPDKIKAPGCAGPVWEVDADGNRLQVSQ